MSKLYNILSNVITRIKSAETKVDELPQADWNQNDESAKDYVKNRPFWTDDPVETVVLEEQTITISEDNPYIEGFMTVML